MPAVRATRDEILRAALRLFAHNGYTGASVQQIVDEARASKPSLYYYFGGKAGLFRALVERAYDERYRLMREAVARGEGLPEQLVLILTALFKFLKDNRDLVRLAFATAFAAPGELPRDLNCQVRGQRNFDFIARLMKKAVAEGLLDKRFTSRELAYGFYGQMNTYILANLLHSRGGLNRRTAERIVALFLAGAAARPVGKPRHR